MLDFAITGLGRCRTAWFSAFLTACGYSAKHEYSLKTASIGDFANAIEPGKLSGICDTLAWMLPVIPARRVVVIHRNIARLEDFVRQETGNNVDLTEAERRLWNVSGLHVDFADIDDRIDEICRYITGSHANREIYDQFKALNIQAQTPAMYAGIPSYMVEAA